MAAPDQNNEDHSGAATEGTPIHVQFFFQTFPGIEKSELAGLILILLSAKRDEATAPASDPAKNEPPVVSVLEYYYPRS